VTRHTLRESPIKLRVLVAEDNPINQVVLVRVLEKMGHAAVVAKDGREALSIANTRKFDLIFMDVQMPHMDGLEATRAIREKEMISGTHVPIFAITARAMKGDSDLCLRAGMDGYIAKPLRFSDVEWALSAVANKMPAFKDGVRKRPAWGQAEALDRVGGDPRLLRELCQIFLQESPKLLERLKGALAEGDTEAFTRAAHILKGEVSYLSADGVFHAARQLEMMGKEKNLSDAAALLARLEKELSELHSVIGDQVGMLQ
jgi:CheY-like chemotaxis protein